MVITTLAGSKGVQTNIKGETLVKNTGGMWQSDKQTKLTGKTLKLNTKTFMTKTITTALHLL